MLIAFLLSLLLTLSPNPEVAPATLEAAPDPEMAAFLPVRQQVDSCLRAGEYQAAWDLLQEAASRFQEAGWLRPLSACRHRQGVVAERMGKDNMAANYFREALQLKKWAFATDYLRLWVLYHEGGVYLDSDVLIERNIDEFLDNQFFSFIEYHMKDF